MHQCCVKSLTDCFAMRYEDQSSRRVRRIQALTCENIIMPRLRVLSCAPRQTRLATHCSTGCWVELGMSWGEGHARSMNGWNPIVDSAVLAPSFRLHYVPNHILPAVMCTGHHYKSLAAALPPRCLADYFSTTSVSRPRCYSYYRLESSPYKLGDGCVCYAGAGGEPLRECL